MSDSLKEWLTGELIRVGIVNADPENKVTMEEALANVAEVIAEAIDRGMTFSIKGSATVLEINLIDDMVEGDTWCVKDYGFIRNEDSEWVEVRSGDLIRYNGSSWELFFHLDLEGYAKKEELAAHVNDWDNPHHVTAAQVGAYTKDEVDDKLREMSKKHLDMKVDSDVVEFFMMET